MTDSILQRSFLATYSQGVLVMLLISTYFVYTPILLQDLKISETQFAFGITIFGITNIIINQLATRFLIPRVGTTNCLIIARLSYSFIPFFIFYFLSFNFYIFLSIIFGAAVGIQAPSLFTQVAIIEIKTKKILNPIFKSSFSVGSILGATLASYCLGKVIDPKILFFLLGLFLFLSTLSMYFFGLSKNHDYVEKSPSFSFPSKIIFLFALVNMMFFASIGIILNWSSLWFLNDLKGPIYLAGFILLFFNIGEVTSNFMASKLINFFNEKIVGPYFTMIGSVILTLSIFTQNVYVILIGMIIFGSMSSNMQPIIFRQAIKFSKESIPKTISHISSIGFSGLIFGPAVVGFSAQKYGLTFNMYVLCIVFFLISMIMAILMSQKKINE